MTDPERISLRSSGLAAELLRAGSAERPSERGAQETLLALGLSAALLGGASATSAAAAGTKLTSVVSAGAGAGSIGVTTAGAVKATSAMLIIKWLGIGVVGGIGLASVAAVATPPSTAPSVVRPTAPLGAQTAQVSRALALAKPLEARATTPDLPAPTPAISVVSPAARVSVSEGRASEQALDVGAPLAAEVAYVDRARTLTNAGRASEGLVLLESYEQKFPEARLLPEVLFLQLEVYERSARSSEARRAAQRLVNHFPKSPHASRARKLLGQ